ncbi:L-asparaginase, type II [Bordetella bronchiseptica GA96-01]|uniref:asparaginase n=1 Tax=Bordetella bronchiseptica TaxID=518 RepID=UPI00045BAACB|nr:asparaginase [Bordetella bronchiseptica]AZW28701.1 asparaginase [Bordetella bronchiseptica]KCV42955.1 L-asparaginase, type II [Bordetella bronchiseptica 345]KDC39670.1 L-asparaginase, type II [Bordetella bronchiseptica GA96-01]
MPEARLPRIAVLATGGTIAGAQTDAASGAYRAGSYGVGQLLAAVPQLAGLARIGAEQIANVGSQNMSHAVWRQLALRAAALCDDPATDGIVITHGTDTLEETAYFLSLVLPVDKPVVLLGAMRPATALSADGPVNLYNAVALACHPAARGRGPLVVMNEDIHLARHVQKMAASGIAAFASPNAGRAGVMQGGRPVFHARAERQAADALLRPEELPQQAWPRVDIVHACVDLDGELIDFMAGRAQGIVLAGVGDGNATDAALQALQRASARGVAVVRASRTGSGRVGRNIEIDDDACGFIAAGDLSPQKARVLLALGLCQTRDTARLQALFDSR